METGEYRSMLLHMEWADSRIWGAILGMPDLGQDNWMRERLYHFHSTQWAYLQMFRGEAIHLTGFDALPDLQAVGRWARQFYRELASFRDALADAALRRHLDFPFAAQIAERLGTAGPATVGEGIVQLALHTAHHRGQVILRLRESGGEPPMTDFIAWVWMLRPMPQWGSLETV